MNRQEALEIVREHITNENLIRHNLAVEAAMRFYAKKLDKDEETWGITGLLHDFDWEIHPSADEHPLKGAPLLRENGVPEEIVRAILSHGNNTEFSRQSDMEKALFACDEITGLITAVALVRPSKSLYDLKVKSVKKKWKDRSFAAAVNREDIENGADDFNVDLWQHIENVITAMRGIAPALGLGKQDAE